MIASQSQLQQNLHNWTLYILVHRFLQIQRVQVRTSKFNQTLIDILVRKQRNEVRKRSFLSDKITVQEKLIGKNWQKDANSLGETRFYRAAVDRGKLSGREGR